MRRSGGGFAALNTRSNPHRRGSDNGFFNGIRPIEASKAVVSYVGNTSTPAVRFAQIPAIR
jgi:hypothetical protein